MSTPTGVVTAVRWSELCPWLILVRAARAALFVRMILLATIGVWITQAGWSAIEGAFVGDRDDVPRLARLTDHATYPLATDDDDLELDLDVLRISRQPFAEVESSAWAGPLVRGWAWAIQPLVGLLDAVGWRSITALVLAGIWVMAAWAVVGGAMARTAALYLTRDELLGPVAALRAGVGGAASTFAAPAFCFAVILLFALLLAAAGFLMRLSLLAFLGAVLWPLALLVGVALTVFSLGLLLGWPFMWSTVAAERTDAFDAVSRGYAFVFQRPLHLAFFVLVATAIGVLAQTAVNVVALGAHEVTRAAVRAGMGDDANYVLYDGPLPINRPTLAPATVKMVRFWNATLVSLATAFPLAYLWPAAMGIYLLQRRLIDSTELGEVALDEAPPTEGVPSLTRDAATSVPAVQPAAPQPVPAPSPTP
jgi:hypothetical protein